MRTALTLIVLLVAAPLYAGDVTASHEGWLTWQEFQSAGELVWEMDETDPFFLFWSPESNYDSTFENEMFAYTVNIWNGRKRVMLRFEDVPDRCGRMQGDARDLNHPDKSLGIINCYEPPIDVPPNPSLNEPTEPPPSIPEPSTWMLLLTGMIIMATKKESRAHFKRSAWNNLPPKPKAIAPTKVSWWAMAAQPEDRDKFMAASKVRDGEQKWTNVIPHAMNPRHEMS